MTQRRRYRSEGRRIVDISDESLDGSAVEGAAVSDFLLEELERRREVRMRDIVATIQSDQYRLITAEPEGALVVQGGPGTGKTAVGLHRASWLLYTHRERLRRVLVVGPNPTFMDYVSHVLPALGEDAVEQRAVSELLDGVEAGREEAPDVARLKADTRLREVVARAVELAVRAGAGGARLRTPTGVFVSVKEREVAALLEEALALGRRARPGEGALPDDGAAPLLRALRRAARRRRAAQLRRARGGRSAGGGFLTRWLDGVLPLPRSDRLVARLLTSPSALAEAAEGILDAAERKLLLRDRPRRIADLVWSEHDLPLLDEARTLLEGPPRAYGHVIVDEAQDLSPMQLLAISRRAVDGSLTILGDVAQATGPVVYRRWQELEPYLPEEAEVTDRGAAPRLPRPGRDHGAGAAAARADRAGRRAAARLPPRRRAAAARGGRGGGAGRAALREAAALAEQDGLVAVIAPRALAAGGAADGDAFDELVVPVLTPRQAKGLEFDHVVVVEPAAIAEDGEQGLRELYVALTRPTRTLVVVHARPLPQAARRVRS